MTSGSSSGVPSRDWVFARARNTQRSPTLALSDVLAANSSVPSSTPSGTSDSHTTPSIVTDSPVGLHKRANPQGLSVNMT